MEQPSLFPLVIDHLYVWVPKAVIEAGAAVAHGLTPKPIISVHDGEGTASQIIYFANMYLELLWVENEAEFALQEESVTLGAQWQATGHSPFGIGFQYRTPTTERLPVATTTHRAAWMPDDSWIEGLPCHSPFLPTCFILHGSLAYGEGRMGTLRHTIGATELTSVRITSAAPAHEVASDAILHHCPTIQIMHGSTPLLELEFDETIQGTVCDMRPTVPLVIRC